MASPIVYILDPVTLEAAGVLDPSGVLVVTRRFWGVDTFTLAMDSRQTSATELTEGRILYVPSLDADDPLAFLIEHIEHDESAAGMLRTVGGRTIDGIAIAERVAMPPAGLAYDEQNAVVAETAMKHYVDANAVSPTDGDRTVPGLAIAPDLARGVTINAAGRYHRIIDLLLEIGYVAGLGWKTTFDPTSGDHLFEIIGGTDRSAEVFFDFAFGTLEEWQELESLLDSKTVVVVAGQGEGIGRDIVIRGSGSGLDRREVFVDARDIELGEIAKLEQRGDGYLGAAGSTTSLQVTPRQYGSFRYSRDWHLGDLVLLRNTTRGISRAARIVEVEITADLSGAVPTIKTTLDKPMPDLKDRVDGPIQSGQTADGVGPIDEVPGALAFTGDETNVLTGAQADVAIGGDTFVLRWNGASDTDWSGMDGGSDGRELRLENVTTDKLWVLHHNSTASTSGHRYLLPDQVDGVIQPGQVAIASYDATATRWRVSLSQHDDLPQPNASPTFDQTVLAGRSLEIIGRPLILVAGVVMSILAGGLLSVGPDYTDPEPRGMVKMWSGTIASIPAGYLLCDGTLGTPDLSDRFIVGTTTSPGTIGGTISPTVALTAHPDHVVTQPAGHSAHVVTQPSAHVFTQPSAHSAHVFTQPSAHSPHVFTQPSAHSNHTALSNHVFTQPSAHVLGASGAGSSHTHTGPSHSHSHTHAGPSHTHAVSGTTAGDSGTFFAQSGANQVSSRPHTHTWSDTSSAAGTGATDTDATLGGTGATGGEALHTHAAGSITNNHAGGAVDAHDAITAHSAHAGGAVDAHSAHSGGAVDAHSAHSGGAIDAHSGTAVDAHSAHIGGTVDAHSAHDLHRFFEFAFVIRN